MKDIKYSVRQLRKSPGFSVVVILIIALGIGANTAIFSLLNSLMLRSLPVRNPQQLRIITWEGNIRPGNNYSYRREDVFSYQTYQEFRDYGEGLAEVFAFSDRSGFYKRSVFVRGRADTVNTMMVSGNFFRGLGLDAFMGQTITPDHDRPEAEPVTVISYAAWRRYFASDPQAIGETVTLNKNSFTIIGVLPKGFQGLVPGESRDFYIPMSAHPQMRGGSAEETTYWWVQIMARLAPDARESQALTSLEALFARAARDAPSREPEKRFRIVMKDGRSGLLESQSSLVASQSGQVASRRDLIKSLHMLLGLAGIVLLVTCVNLAGLLLARGAQRQHEIAVRAALGAGRWLLIRQLLTESVLIVLVGAGLGLVLAYWGKTALFHLLFPPGAILDLHSDSRVLFFTLVISLATALLAGLLPAFSSTRSSSVAILKDRSGLGIPRLKLGRALVSVQIGLSLILLIGAGLFARTLVNLYLIDTGFNTRNLLVFQVNASQAGYKEQQEKDFHKKFYTSLRSLPGVVAVGRSNLPLLAGIRNTTQIRLPNSSESFRSIESFIDQSFLATMGIPLIVGREFNDSDFETASKIVIVNKAFVKLAYPDDNPIDKIVSSGFQEFEDYRIIGVCRDIKYNDIRDPSKPIVFRPNPGFCGCYMVRTEVNPQSLIPAVRKTLASIDPTIPLKNIKTQSIQLDESITRERCFTSLAMALALLAVLLSCIGLYGVMAYNVERRTGEIGLRMALGATPQNIAWPILRSALLMAAAGIAIAVPVVFATVRIVRSYLFGIVPHDPVTLICAIVLLLIVTVMAVWLPARRAAKIDPMEALRYE